MALVASLILALFVTSSTVQAHFQYGKRANDYNFSLEIVKLDQDEKPVMEDISAKDPSVGHLQFAVYVADQSYKTIDDAQVELVFTQCGETSAPIQLKFEGYGKYVGIRDLSQPGTWDFTATAHIPTVTNPIVVAFQNINFLGTGNSSPCPETASTSAQSRAKGAAPASTPPWLLIGAVVIILLAIVLLLALKPKRVKKGT
jgi:hypothetical protein